GGQRGGGGTTAGGGAEPEARGSSRREAGDRGSRPDQEHYEEESRTSHRGGSGCTQESPKGPQASPRNTKATHLYSRRHNLRHLPATSACVERWPNRSCSHARNRPCRASPSPRTTCRPLRSSASTTPSRSCSASWKSSGSSPKGWPTTTSPA